VKDLMTGELWWSVEFGGFGGFLCGEGLDDGGVAVIS